MATQLALNEILEKVIQREIESQLLYTDLSQKMKDQVAKDAFQELVRQEQGHQKLLERYLRGELKKGALSRGQVLDYKIAEHLEQPEISPDMKLEDVFLLAANREKASPTSSTSVSAGFILLERQENCLKSWHHRSWRTSKG